jgi:hypothetical protein
MNLRQIGYFTHVAEFGSFSGASGGHALDAAGNKSR